MANSTYAVYCRGKKKRWVKYSSDFTTMEEAEKCRRRAEESRVCDTSGVLVQFKTIKEENGRLSP